ncbi:MAG TPA: DUF3341 domain-containing protein [Gemmataceae bacterium]|nr:DUF3341 domain-containing protein [Gemmataceae bacterium]
MSAKIMSASFAQEDDLIGAVRAVQDRGWDIVDVYGPYAVHGLEQVLNWPRSRLPVACFFGGALGVGLAAWFQYWATAWDWPLNVGGRPWNSLPAFVPVIFECMVLLAGFSLLFAWLFRCRLYPGKEAEVPRAGVTDDQFLVVFRVPSSVNGTADVQQLMQACHAVSFEERNEGEKP